MDIAGDTIGDRHIELLAEVVKVQTLCDGGIRVTLDLPESAIAQMAELAKCQQDGVLVKIRIQAM